MRYGKKERELIITLTNDFHNSSVNVRVAKIPAVLSASQVRRIRRELCGQRNCACRNVAAAAIRGKQYAPNGPQIVIDIAGPEEISIDYAYFGNK